MSYQDVVELDNIWGFFDGVLSDAALCHEYGRDEIAWCDMVVLPHMQYTVKRKEKPLMELDNPHIDPK